MSNHYHSGGASVRIAIAIAAATIAFSSHAASTFDLSQVFRLPGSLFIGSDCEKLKQWAAPVASRPGYRRTDELMLLVEDKVFEPLFGKTYDQLDANDFQKSRKLQNECFKARLLPTAEAGVVQMAWDPTTHAQLSRKLVAGRAQRAEFEALGREMAGLQATEADERRLDAIQLRAESLASAVGADAMRDIRARAAEARERIGVPVAQQRVAAALASASGSDGLDSLMALQTELGRSKLSATHTEPLRTSVQARIVEIGNGVAAAERQSAPPPPTDLAGLQASKNWLTGFQRRHQQAMAHVPALSELRDQVTAQRAAAIAREQPVLAAQVRAAMNSGQLNGLLAAYLLDEEMRDGPGRALQTAANERASLLQRLARDEAVFGRQPEHDALLRGTPAQQHSAAASPATPEPAAAARCDKLAAHEDDPQRKSAPVSDDAMDVKQAVAACAEAVKALPAVGRLHFQYGRALLEANQVGPAVEAFKKGAQLNHGGSYTYLASAYEAGGGVRKNTKLAEEYAAKGAQLGFGSGAALAAASPGAKGSGVLASAAELERFEDASLIKAVYFGDASGLNGGSLYTYAYLLAQADVLAQQCDSFKLTEIERFKADAMRAQLPGSSDQAMQQGMNQLATGLKAMMDMARNPRSMVDMAERQRRVENAPAYGGKDLVKFVEMYGGCKSAPLARYTGNLRNFFTSAARTR